MADFVPPSGPPPPKVPEGWKAVWNDQYKEWFYVNLHTKESTWEKPTAPAPHGNNDGAPPGPPPGYSSGPNDPVVSGDSKKALDSSHGPSGGETDAQLAARLQAEENTRASGSTSRGAAEDYYTQSQQYPQRPPGYDQQTGSSQGNVYGQGQGQYAGPSQGQYQSPQSAPPAQAAASGNKGLFSKLLGKTSKPTGGYGQQQGYGAPQQGYGAPQQGYGYGQQAGYGPQYGGGYAAAPVAAAQPQRKHGMGALGAGALGLGGGLLGGMLLEHAINDGRDDGRDDGGDDGGGGRWGGDDGGYGGDDGGGDFGGDGGGDFGGDF